MPLAPLPRLGEKVATAASVQRLKHGVMIKHDSWRLANSSSYFCRVLSCKSHAFPTCDGHRRAFSIALWAKAWELLDLDLEFSYRLWPGLNFSAVRGQSLWPFQYKYCTMTTTTSPRVGTCQKQDLK